MAKRRAAAKTDEQQSRRRLLKVLFTDKEMQQLRVAAAMQNQRATAFARVAILESAQRVQSDYLAEMTKG